MAVLAWATVWVLPAGVLILLALMPGGVPTRQVHANPPPTATAGTTTSTPLSTTTVQSTRTTIAPGTAIRGCIYVGPATSTPIEMAYVKLFTSGEEFTFVADTFSNEQGYYQFTGMAAGTYEAHIYAYDYEYIGPGDTPGNAYEIPGGLRVALGDTTVADAYLDPEAIVTGQVTISVGATPLASVLISAEGTDGVLLYAVTDVGGNYAVRNLFTGTFTLSAHKPGWEFADQNGIAVTQGQTTSGTVYESDGKTPIPGAVVFNFTTGCHRNSVHGTLGVSASQ